MLRSIRRLIALAERAASDDPTLYVVEKPVYNFSPRRDAIAEMGELLRTVNDIAQSAYADGSVSQFTALDKIRNLTRRYKVYESESARHLQP